MSKFSAQCLTTFDGETDGLLKYRPSDHTGRMETQYLLKVRARENARKSWFCKSNAAADYSAGKLRSQE